MGTAKSPDLGHAHPFTGASLGTVVTGVLLATAVKPGSLGTAVTGGTREESRGRAAALVTTITDTVARRPETKTPEDQNRGILHTGD